MPAIAFALYSFTCLFTEVIPMNQLDIYKIKARAPICLLLFALGGICCLALDLLGIPSISTEPLLNSPLHIPIPVWAGLIAAYSAAGLVIGFLCKNRLTAVIYGACFSQCQFLLPLIFHSGTFAEVIGRSVLIPVITICLAGGAASIRLIVSGPNKNKQ